jgi:hypothetical protein
MLKSHIRLLVTLVLALVATAIFSTLSPASGVPSRDGSVAAAATGNVKPRPIALTGDPDAPQAPPPPITMSGRIRSPLIGDQSLVGVTAQVRWISWIWATWYWRTTP